MLAAVKDAARRFAVACGHHLTATVRGAFGSVRPGRRNAACQPNQETSGDRQRNLAKQAVVVTTHFKQRGGKIFENCFSHNPISNRMGPDRFAGNISYRARYAVLSGAPVMTTDLRTSLPIDARRAGSAIRNDGRLRISPGPLYEPVESKRAACEAISDEFVDEGTETHAP